MKRQGNLWDRMTSFENLLRAGHAAARGKRFKPAVACFVFDLERQLLRLHDELAAKTYRPGPYRVTGLVQVARSRGNTFLDVRPCCSGRKRCRNNAFRASVQGLYAAKCYLGLNQADLADQRRSVPGPGGASCPDRHP